MDCRRGRTNHYRQKEILEKHFEVVTGTSSAPVAAESCVIALQETIRADLPTDLRQPHHRLVRADAPTDHLAPANP